MSLWKNNVRLVVLSVISSIALLLLCYFMDNWSYSVGGGPTVGQRVEQVKELLGKGEDRLPEEYVFINTAYDRELVPVYDEYELPKGEIDITDRGKLAKFLSELDDNHRYVMLDILLDDEFHSPSDSLLIATILKMQRIGIARTGDKNLLSPSLISRSGLIDYSAHIYESNFVKYEYVKDGDLSLPYRMFLEEQPDAGIRQVGPFYFHNNNLAWKTLTLRFPIKLWHDSKQKEGMIADDLTQETVLYNLGADILDMGVDIPALVKDKIVVIGDFTERDIHDTYVGSIAGSIINVNAFEALQNNELEIPWWLVATLFVLYSLITVLIFRPVITIELFRKITEWFRKKSRLLVYLLSFAGYSFLFLIIGIIIYLASGYDINIFLPSLWFTLISSIKNYKTNAEK